jgi:hypothetical protein
MKFGALSVFGAACVSEGDSAQVGAGVRLVLRICHDEEREEAFATAVPVASKSSIRIRFSRPSPRSRSRTFVLSDVLDELVLRELCLEGSRLSSSRAERQAEVRMAGSSSENR